MRLYEHGFANEAEVSGFMKRIEELLDQPDKDQVGHTDDADFVCTCQDCEVQRAG